jgi:hypothetical protein
MRTVYHVVNGLWVIFAEVNDTSLRFPEAVAAGSLEEGGSGCKEYAVYWVSFRATNNGQI